MKDLTLPTLLPCPFCGAGETQMRENGRVWGGKGYGEPSSVSVVHWCAKVDGQPSRVLERVGRDKHSAIEAWNTRAALSSHQAATDKESLTVAPVVALGGEPPCSEHPDAPHGYNRSASHNAGRYVCDCEGWAALGGEKGEAVAWQWQTEDGQVGFIDPWQKESGWEQANPRAKLIRPLFAAPVGKARMLTDEEADHITGMHNTGRSQGDSECAEAIQRKFCEVNGITLQGGA